MASLTIRNLDDTLKSSLRLQAAQHDCSMEEEARQILRKALTAPRNVQGLGKRLSQRFQAIGGVDLPIPARSQPRAIPDWDETA